jgi:phosphatidylglycerol:prolipoprotein diacylglycerol transferase
MLALTAEWWLARRRVLQRGLDASHIDLVLPLSFVAALFAAPLLAGVIPQEHSIAGDALVVEHRLRLPAVLIAGLAVVWAYGRLARIPVLSLADVIAPAALLFVAILRIGCFLAGCCFGDVVGHFDVIAAMADDKLQVQVQTLSSVSSKEISWAVQFAPASAAFRQHEALGLVAPDATASLPVHPVQLYEALAALLLCLAALGFERTHPRPGMLTLFAASGYAAAAFSLQFLRADGALLIGPLTGNQVLFLTWLGFVPLAVALLRRERTGRGRLNPGS